MHNKKEIVGLLISEGNKILEKPKEERDFTKIHEANILLNDLERYPHAFVLACIMDRQIKASRAWAIPHEVSKGLGGFEFDKLLRKDLSWYKKTFRKRALHRFNDSMANYFYLGIHQIHEKYHDDASNIWNDTPSSATLIRRFLEFNGVGIKIATMAANILSRKFRIPLRDKIYLDVSPDVHVRRVFTRLGFIPKKASNDEIIYCARELNPDYPGIFDLPTWHIGINWCKKTNPNCSECYLSSLCPKII